MGAPWLNNGRVSQATARLTGFSWLAFLTAWLLLGSSYQALASADFPPDCAPLGPNACSSMLVTPFRYNYHPTCEGSGPHGTEQAAVADIVRQLTPPNQCSFTISPAGSWLSTSHFTIGGCGTIVWNGPLPWIDSGTGFELLNGRVYNVARVYPAPTCEISDELAPVVTRSREQSCPPGMIHADYNGKRYCRGDAPAKSLGKCKQCSGVGNPIHFATGNKYQQETDYAAVDSPLVFERHYNSISYPIYASDQFTAIGKLWRHTYDRWITEVVSTSLTTANVYHADGKVFSFNLYNGAYYPDKDVSSKLTRVFANGAPSGWRYVEEEDDSEETYNNEGRLTEIKLRSGVTLSLTYNSGRLSAIVDSFGRQIQLSYDAAGRIERMIDPTGGQYWYEYATNGNLIKVT